VDLSNNKIKELTGMPQPKLLKVKLDNNLIEKTELFSGHSNLVSLELRRNRLTNL